MNGLILLAAADSPTNMIVIVVGVVVILAAAWFAYQSSKSAKTYNDALARLDAERAEFERTKKSGGSSSTPKKVEKKAAPKKVEKKAAPKKDDGPSKQEVELRERLDDARTALDELKQKSYEQTEELKELRARDKAARDAKPSASSDVLFDLRQELGEAKAEVENLKTRLADSRRSGGKKAPADEPAPEKVEKPRKVETAEKTEKTEKTDADAGAASVDVDAIHDDYRSKISALERDKESLERDLRGKLKRSSRDIDRQRRRADNNDKAYKITQRELDASRERIALLEAELGRVAYAANQAAQDTQDDAPAQPDAEQPDAEQPDATPASQDQQNLFDASAEAQAETPTEQAPAAVTEDTTEAATTESVEAAPEAEETTSEEATSEPEHAAETAAEEEPAPSQDEPAAEVAPTEEPSEAPAEEPAQEEVAEAAPESETDIDDEIRRKIEEGTSSLGAEPSSVDEAWADIDLDDDEL